MADPRLQSLEERLKKDKRSDLIKAKEKAGGEKVNFCPFGCEDHHLDENGYCRHLIGFTNDKKHFEPMIRGKHGRRRVKVEKVGTGEFVRDMEEDDEGKEVMVEEEIMVPVLEPVLPTDKLVQISISYRVYRDVPKPSVAKSA